MFPPGRPPVSSGTVGVSCAGPTAARCCRHGIEPSLVPPAQRSREFGHGSEPGNEPTGHGEAELSGCARDRPGLATSQVKALTRSR